MEPAPAIKDRSTIEDFEVLKELGRGTWGRVQLVRRKQDGLLYALKTVALTRSPRDQLAAVQEAQMLASLSSPHIVQYYDSFLYEGCLHICMEYAAGGSLHACIRAAPRPLPEDAIWRVLLHTTLALHHMHSRRMLHRDVKSLNVFLSGPLDQQPQFKLGDMGVSKVLAEGINMASTVTGTPFYLSPEICQEKPYDAKSDIWSLGVLLYECATRRFPFDAQSQPGLIMKILRGRYDPVLGLGPDLTSIIHRCLSQAAGRRPSAETLLSLPAVRAKAAELGVELPLLPSPSAALLSPAAAALASARAQGMRAVGSQLPRPLPRRATCPEGGPPEGRPAAVPADGRAARRTSGSGERRKPLLPPAAVPHRRRTVQVDERGHGGAAAAPLPAVPRTTATARARSALAAAQAPRTPAGSAPGTPASELPPRPPPLAPAPVAMLGPAPRQPSAQRESHFSVQQHLGQLGGAARQWLLQQGAGGIPSDSASRCSPAPAGAPADAGAAVQRSAKSDSCLPPLAGARRAVHAAYSSAGLDGDGGADDEERQGALRQLRQRCVALLGSETLFEELHALAKTSVDAGGGSCTEGGPAAPRTLAALSDALQKRAGGSGHAAEALHLLLRMLYFEG